MAAESPGFRSHSQPQLNRRSSLDPTSLATTSAGGPADARIENVVCLTSSSFHCGHRQDNARTANASALTEVDLGRKKLNLRQAVTLGKPQGQDKPVGPVDWRCDQTEVWPVD